MSIFSDLVKYSRLAFDLRQFLKTPVTLEQSKLTISHRLKNREQHFLNLVQKGIYQNPRSPYRQLLQYAGCEYTDFESSVNKNGIEPTLQNLLNKGVYISWEEFKGKKEVVRGGKRFYFKETDFDNPYLSNYYQVRSGGSRSAGTRTVFDLRHRAEMSYYYSIMLEANRATGYPMVLWFAGLPSIAGIGALIQYARLGQPVIKWFSPAKPENLGTSLRDRLAANFIIYGGRFWGAKLVKPQYVSIENASEIAVFLEKVNKSSGGCNICCFVSQAVQVCQAAIEKNIDIQGVHFFVGGEPLSQAKRKQIEAAGALVTPRYHITEIGSIGFSCMNSTNTDDVHLFHDTIAAIQHKRQVEHTDIMVDAFMFSNLLVSAPKILLNVECDDYGLMETRDCGCLYDELGFNRHISNIRSFAKLTGSGMTIIGSDLVYILEEILPKKYGGSAADYQIIEEEDNNAQTYLNLLISPTRGNIVESDVIATILNELRRSVNGGKLAAGFWSQINTLRVKRSHPVSSSGKILTLHLKSRNYRS